jgi:hypothetical protein
MAVGTNPGDDNWIRKHKRSNDIRILTRLDYHAFGAGQLPEFRAVSPGVDRLSPCRFGSFIAFESDRFESASSAIATLDKQIGNVTLAA